MRFFQIVREPKSHFLFFKNGKLKAKRSLSKNFGTWLCRARAVTPTHRFFRPSTFAAGQKQYATLRRTWVSETTHARIRPESQAPQSDTPERARFK
jgi:hypothetical protein